MTTMVRGILSRLPRQLDPTTLVFPNTEGNRDLRWAKKIIPAALRDAKIADFRFHDLRHTFASRLAMEGVDLLTLKELGGWKSLQMVQRYAHLSPSHRRSAIERLVRRPTSASLGTEQDFRRARGLKSACLTGAFSANQRKPENSEPPSQLKQLARRI